VIIVMLAPIPSAIASTIKPVKIGLRLKLRNARSR
jgi:hypothetical protein